MGPDYQRSASAAVDTLNKYGINSAPVDPIAVLSKLRNVVLISFASAALDGNGQEAITMVNRQDGKLQYIIMYNSDLSQSRLRRVLSRELGHVVLEHDRETPEEVASEEADCFSFHFLCPKPAITIYFRPDHRSVSWSFKDMQKYPSMDALKQAIAEERTRFSRFIGKSVSYTPDDVQIHAEDHADYFGGWKNYSSVLVDGKTVGFCGE